MKTALSSIFAIVLFPALLIGQTEFLRTYDQLTSNTSIAYSIKATSDGGFVCIGGTNNEEDPDIFLVKTNAEGGAEWAKQCSGADSSPDVALDIIPTEDGGYLFCGNSDQRRILWKTDSLGNDLWKAPFGEKGLDAFTSVIEDNDGNFLAVGDGMVMTKIDANGNELWTRNKPTERTSAYRVVKSLPNGDFLVGGFFTARDKGRALTILAKMDSEGRAYWAETYGAGIINAIDTDAEGNIWVAGNASYAAPVVLKINPDGKAIWEGVYDEDQLGSAHSITVDDEKGAVVFTSGGFFKIGTDGELSEKQTTPHYGFNGGFANPDGSMILAGFSDESINGYEKFTFMKIGEGGFPAPTASAQ